MLTFSTVELNLQETKMQTSIPTSITTMVNLEILDLTYSGIAGTLPSEIGALTKLQRTLSCWEPFNRRYTFRAYNVVPAWYVPLLCDLPNSMPRNL
jgi:hypothetical protein